MARGKWRTLVLALAMVLAQCIALIHGIAHAPLLLGLHPSAQQESGGEASQSVVARLFGDHHDQNGNAKCHLFDQSNHPDGLCTVHSVVFPAHFATVLPVAFAGVLAARWLHVFHARGPPSFR